MELAGLRWILERLLELVAQPSEMSQNPPSNDEQREYAVTSLMRALNETEIYYGNLRHENTDRSKEAELSRMWTEVSREIRPIDAELARRCELKGRFWADPVGWNPNQVMEMRITIAEMREALKKLTQGN